jgi:hypothetical protein
MRNKPPTQRVERHISGLVIAADDQQFLAGRGVPSRWIVVHPAVAYVHAIHDGIAKRSAALDDPPTHAADIVIRGCPHQQEGCRDPGHTVITLHAPIQRAGGYMIKRRNKKGLHTKPVKGKMRPRSLWLLLVADENGKLQNGDLSAGQQGRSAGAS